VATSGSSNYSTDRDGLITEALQICKAIGEGGSPSSNQLSDCSRTLNMMVKAWMSKGLQLWTIEKLVLFPVKNQAIYSFGTGADRMCKQSDFQETELNGDHASGATTLTVAGKDGTTSMTSGDVIGVQTDSGGISWTTINGAPTSTSIVLTAGISAAASDNNNVYTYTTAFSQRLLRINNIWRRSDDRTDVPIQRLSRQEYSDLSNKTEAGQIISAYYDPQLDPGLLSVYQVPDDNYTDSTIFIRGARPFEDFDAATDTPDFPQEWYLPIAWNLAWLLGPKFGVTGAELNEIGRIAAYHLAEVSAGDAEDGSIYFVPETQ